MATGYDSTLNPAHAIWEPAEQRVPFVFNSPHSGRNYRPEFLTQIRLDRASIRRSEDFRVDELFAGAVAIGCPMLVAHFPRAYLDVNREPYELDPAMFDDRLPPWVNSRSVRVAGGLGTIARIVSETEEIYARRLSAQEGLERIEAIYKPYHAALRGLLSRTHARFGHAVLVDCHSMPSSRDGPPRKSRPDFVLGDRYGASCAEALTWSACEFLTAMGYEVEINKPYAGGFSLYMNEATLEKTNDFQTVRAMIEDVVKALLPHLEERFQPSQLAAE